MGPHRHLAAALDLAGRADLLRLQSPDDASVAPQDSQIGRRMTLAFNDIAAPRPGLVAASSTDVAALLDFGRNSRTLVIQCFAGVSRSTAAAYILACQATPPGSEERLAAALRRLSPAATPNPLMVRLADDVLDRSGRMIRAIAGIGRGEDAAEGPVFAWAVEDHPAGD